MNYFNSLIISGLVVGTLYGLVAMGFTVIYKVSRVLNFAQGEVMMLTAFVGYSIAVRTDGSQPLVIAGVMLASVIIAGLVERLIIRPMLGQPVFSIVMMTIALSVLLRSVIGLVWGADPLRMPGSSAAPVSLLGVSFQPAQIVLVGVYLAACGGLWAFLRFSLLGIAMRASAADPTVTMLMGLSIRRLYRLGWVISAVLAGLSGLLFANIYHLGLDMGHVGIAAFPAAILGGLDSVLGAALGGLVIGVAENLAGGYIGSGFKEVASFAIILLVLMVRPHGLFGEKDIERV
ncbi:MAG TPA: branched-chain amino acid ABC transporter permease [Ramlibacter sp.]|nr:branched-chain amino acid ABC transporter permease [Ramlibacter sp.]